jgi:short-subunit dehydrogenase
MESGLNGKVVWLTGSSRGIGENIANKLADKGAILVMSARSAALLDNVKKELSSSGIGFIYPCDVSSSNDVNNTYNKILKNIGDVDILINNAGVAAFKSINELSLNDFDIMLGTNLRGAFICIKSVLPAMIKKKQGIILNIISVAATKAFTGSSIYSASKAGLLAMSRSMREDLRSHGIKVIDILPGATETELWSSKSREKYGKRMIKPAELANIIVDILEKSLDNQLMIEEVVIRPQLGDLS